LSVERWSAGSKRLMLSISSPKKSSRRANFSLDPLALCDAAGELADAKGRQQPLRRRAGRCDQQLRLVAFGLQRA